MAQLTGDWSTVASLMADVATVVGIGVGGTWAYYKFLKGQTFHPTCHLDLVATLVDVSGHPALRVEVTIRNGGLSPMRFSEASERELSIVAIDAPIWEEAQARGGNVMWSEGISHIQHLHEGEPIKLQVQESLGWSVVVPLPEGQCCYLVRLKVLGVTPRFIRKDRIVEWERDQVIVPEEA